MIVFPRPGRPLLIGFDREFQGRLSRHRSEMDLDSGSFRQLLVGGSGPEAGILEFIMSASVELPIDGEGRIVLPRDLASHSGIADRATFVGRGHRFEIWSPETFDAHMRKELRRVQEYLDRDEGGEGW